MAKKPQILRMRRVKANMPSHEVDLGVHHEEREPNEEHRGDGERLQTVTIPAAA